MRDIRRLLLAIDLHADGGVLLAVADRRAHLARRAEALDREVARRRPDLTAHA